MRADVQSVPDASPPALELRGVRKSFAGVTVLHDVDLVVRPATIHALVGHNGSGKSTLIKALAGFHTPDDEVTASVFGTSFRLGDYTSAAHAGVRFVHQDLGLVDQLSTVDNLALGPGYPLHRGGTIRWREAAKRSARAMRSLGYDFDVTVPVSTLSAAERTGVAIARALESWSGQPKVIVLDEPTAAMPAPEAHRLHDTMLRLREQGLGIVLVSHHLDEVLKLSDDITVLRNGHVVATRSAEGLTHDELVSLIVGQELAKASRDQTSSNVSSTAKSVFEVSDLSTDGVRGLSFAVGAGEIVGIAGITGSGREHLLPAIAGAIDRAGDVRIAGTLVPPRSPRAAIRAGLGFVPADRRRAAVLPSFGAGANLTVSGMKQHVRLGLLNHRAERGEQQQWLEDLDVRPAQVGAPILTLSGGNQQKVMVGRWLRRLPTLLALDEPTQGVDIGARHTIYAAIHRAADAGAGVLVSSSDTEELVEICDRVLVLVNGHSVAELSGPMLAVGDLDALSLGESEVA